MKHRIAIIPARAGSKRIPRKNVRDFCGRPMIGHILQVAHESGLFDVIHVSTESPEIRETVEKLGFPVDFLRPDRLADDYTPIMPVLKYVVESYRERGQHFDEVWLLMACAPFIEPDDLRGAADMLEKTTGTAGVMAVAPYPVPIEWAYARALDGKLTPLQPGKFAIRSQDFEKRYFETGTFVAFPAETVLSSEGAGSNDGFLGYPLERRKAIDIDDDDDWALAEAMFQYRQRAVL